MSTLRKIIALHRAERDDIGDLITRRPLPSALVHDLDPFLFLNHHGPQIYPPHNQGLPFGPHPHRGFSTLTFILAGSLEHQDSGDYQSIMHAGGVQWMTAGRGVVHSELSPAAFMREGGKLEILQLWINLPQKLKMIEPYYCGVENADIPVIKNNHNNVRSYIVCDCFSDVKAPIIPPIDLYISWVEMDKDSTHGLHAPSYHRIFFYVVRGELHINNQPVSAFTLLECADEGELLDLRALEDSVIIFGHSPPHGDPIVYGGPFVMNSDEEIRQAFADYRKGLLGKI
jgi:quercetin 2,3-dioxygenase